MRRLLVIGLSILAWMPAGAQRASHVSVVGRVVDAENGLPLGGAHVFVAETMRGTTTASDGRYRLASITPGVNRLVASMIGYAPATIDSLLRPGEPHVIDIALRPEVHLLSEILVKAERPSRWTRRLRAFRRLFLGESSLGAQARLLNAEVLDFDGGWGRLRARAAAPLEIENAGLGYRIRYVLRVFDRSGVRLRYDGDPLFTEMTPSSPDEARAWARRRCEAFFGSYRHFMLSVLDGTTGAAGYRLERRGRLESLPTDVAFAVSPESLIAPGPAPDLHVFKFTGYLDVTYLHKAEDPEFMRWHYRGSRTSPRAQRSWLRLTSREVLVDDYGEPLDPFGITLYGYFAFQRLADQLPKEYRPPPGVTNPRECDGVPFGSAAPDRGRDATGRP